MNRIAPILSAIGAFALSLALIPASTNAAETNQAFTSAPATVTTEISTVRDGSQGTQQGLRDPGLMALNRVLAAALERAEGNDVGTALEVEAVKVYGVAQVVGDEEKMAYTFHWNEEHQIWTIRCTVINRLSIDDGQATNLLVTIKTSMNLS